MFWLVNHIWGIFCFMTCYLVAGGRWSLCQRSSGGRQDTPWTGEPIGVQHTEDRMKTLVLIWMLHGLAQHRAGIHCEVVHSRHSTVKVSSDIRAPHHHADQQRKRGHFDESVGFQQRNTSHIWSRGATVCDCMLSAI
ncbi:hypothetical protein AOLI_G00099750 [Acnodon oligacanthus]